MTPKTELLILRIKQTMEMFQDLEKTYHNKNKGQLYTRRYIYLKDKFRSLVEKLGKLGMGTAIVYYAEMTNSNTLERVNVQVTLLDTFSREDVKNLLKIRTSMDTIDKLITIEAIQLGQVFPVKKR